MTLSRHPTRGAMISELERIGVRVRGTEVAADDKALAKLLRERGYTVSEKPGRDEKPETER